MTITEVAYCTREMVQRALNLADNPRLNDRVDNAIMSGARQVEGTLHRRFYPETTTYAFDQPDDEYLWLYRDLAGTPIEILSGGTPMTVDADVLLRPHTGPPYRWLEARFSGGVFWQAEDTPQNSIVITGDWGYPTTIVPVATVAGITATAVQLDFSAQVGVGSLILIGAERMIVTGKTFVTTGTTITADLGTSKSVVAVAVSDGTAFEQGEMIVIDSERMFVEDVIGDNLIVDRAVAGSVLAAHTTGAVPYAPRTASVLRGVLGTSNVSHTVGDTVSLIKPPSLITELNLAYAVDNDEKSLGAYARTAGSTRNAHDAEIGRGIADLEDDAYERYGVKTRSRAVM